MTDMTETKTVAEELPLDDKARACAIEAILFAAGHPITFEKLAAALSCDEETVRKTVEELQPTYQARGIQLIYIDEGCQLVTKEDYLPYIRTALGIRRGGNLSKASMETLAIVAYNQPVTRSYIDEVRGVDTSYVVTSLLEKGLLEAKGRLDAPGRPTLYGTTDTFLRVFGLNNLGGLPSMEAFMEKVADGEGTDEAAALFGKALQGSLPFDEEASDEQ